MLAAALDDFPRQLASTAAGAVTDPRIDPTGQRVAYVTGGALHVTELADGTGRPGGRRRAARGRPAAPGPAAAGRPHQVLPLSGTTHMPTGTDSQLLRHGLESLAGSLGVTRAGRRLEHNLISRK